MKKERKAAKTAAPARTKTNPSSPKIANYQPQANASDGTSARQKGDPAQGKIKSDNDQSREDEGPSMSAQEIKGIIEKLQELQADYLEEILPREDLDPNVALGRSIVRNRQTAKDAIAFLTSASKAGNDLALEALYEIATLAAEELGDQSFERRKLIAGSHVEWPLLLNNSKNWNKKLIERNVYSLGLGKELSLSANLDYIVTKPSDLKEIVARLLALIVGWRGEPTEMEAATRAAQALVAQGYGEEASQHVLSLGHKNLEEAKKMSANRINGLKRLLNIKKEIDSIEIYNCREQAVALAPITKNLDTQTQWFGVAMNVLEVLTNGEYHLPRFNLRQSWGGIRFESEQEDRRIRSELKANIRDQMKKAFHKMVLPTAARKRSSRSRGNDQSSA